MARGKRKNTIIQVKSAPSNSCVAINPLKPSKDVTNHICDPETTPVVVKSEPHNAEKRTGHINVSSTIATDVARAGTVARTQHFAPRYANKKKKIEEAFVEVELKITGPTDNAAKTELQTDGVEVEEKQKNEKYKNINETTDAEKQNLELKTPGDITPRKKGSAQEGTSSAAKISPRNHTGCFGFISTWLAKRKERRRAKKRKAIQRRNTNYIESLVVHGQKSSRGGVAFTVELDSRPMRKPVLPSTRQRPGHVRLCNTQKMERAENTQKMERAENNRVQHISKKIEAAQAHALHVMKVGVTRDQNEYIFKLKTLQKIEAKAEKALRATSQLEHYWYMYSIYGGQGLMVTPCTSSMEDADDVESDVTVSPADDYCTDEDLFAECSIEHEFVDVVT